MKHRSAMRALAIAAALAGAAMAGQASAHAKLVIGDPAPNATIPAPKTIHLLFSEAVVAKFSGVELMKADGSTVPVKAAAMKDPKVAAVMIPAALPPGSYRVMWHAVAADDGHKTNGSYNFTVR